MMKRLLIVIVLLASVILVGAQEPETVFPLSGRYSFILPEGWVSTQEGVGQLLAIFPGEGLILADSQATLDFVMTTQPDPADFAEFAPLEGSFLYAVVWPSGLFESMGLDGETFASLVTVAASPEESDFVVNKLEGKLFSGESAGNAVRVLAVADSAGNTLMVFGFAPAGQADDLDAAIQSVFFIDAAEIPAEGTYEVSFMEETVFMDVPYGWWYLQSDTSRMVLSSFGAEMVEAMQNRDYAAFQDIAVLAQEMAAEDFAELMDAEGNIDPERVENLISLLDVFGEDVEAISNFSVENWTSADGTVQGAALSMEMDQGIYAYMLVIPGETNIGVVGFTSVNSPQEQRDLLRTVVDTIRFAPAE
ncbi:MAG: hypothetical protein KJ064_00795 [Anaerolineae bacterium]|nr:hypothetical protein [Anaerolineae bacterium]